MLEELFANERDIFESFEIYYHDLFLQASKVIP